jgi:hypothetical protein
LADLFEKALFENAQRAVDRRVAFLRSRPTMTVAPELAPRCLCWTNYLWRTAPTAPWRCYACDPRPHGVEAEVIRADIAGRPRWDASARRWV